MLECQEPQDVMTDNYKQSLLRTINNSDVQSSKLQTEYMPPLNTLVNTLQTFTPTGGRRAELMSTCLRSGQEASFETTSAG